jgi:hypothetical protein
MAIFGIGAYYDDVGDVTEQFISGNLACVGYSKQDAPPAHSILHQIRIGDIIFIKSFTPNTGLNIKAIGIVTQDEVCEKGSLGSCIPVRWVWIGNEHIGKLNDKWPVRSVTIYEEKHPTVQARIVDLLLEHI